MLQTLLLKMFSERQMRKSRQVLLLQVILYDGIICLVLEYLTFIENLRLQVCPKASIVVDYVMKSTVQG